MGMCFECDFDFLSFTIFRRKKKLNEKYLQLKHVPLEPACEHLFLH